MATDISPTPADIAVPRPLRRKRMRPADAIFHGAILVAVLILLGALAWLMVSIITQGWSGLSWAFLTDPVTTRANTAGFNSALRGSAILMLITFSVAIPIGFAGAVYLEKFAPISRDQLLGGAYVRQRRLRELEQSGVTGMPLLMARLNTRGAFGWARFGPPVNRAIEVNISNLAAVPSIIYGLLGLAVFIAFAGLSKSLLAGGLTLALLVLPIIIIAAREAVREESGEEEVPLRLLPRLRLVAREPVSLRLRLEIGNRASHAGEAKGGAPESPDRRNALRPPLVEPDDRRPKRPSLRVRRQHRRPLRRHGEAGDRFGRDARLREQAARRRADRPPVELRVLLGEAGRSRDVRLDRDAAPREEVARKVEQERADALRPVVDREEPLAAHAQRAADAAGAE